jgi:hypothetical protein
MPRGPDIEERWVRLWSEMFDARERDPHLVFVDEGWQPISFEHCQGLVQDAVYRGHHPRFEGAWFQGRRALRVFLNASSKG